MEHPRIVEIVRRAWREAHGEGPSFCEASGEVPVRAYTDPERLAAERALFRRTPIPIAHASEIAAGAAIVRELDGVSLVLARSADGVLRAFRNACRHRGVRLLREDCPKAKAFTCPYHGWTYALDGALMHVPHAEAFPGLTTSTRGLVAVASVEERHGIVWAALDASAPLAAAHLAEIDEEVASLDLASHVVGGRVVREQRGNWKMLVEAFLDGYHIRTLHRDTVYPFFLDARMAAERAGFHIRTASARRTAKECRDDAAFEARPLRDVATLTLAIFPSTTIVAHPDWTSLVVVQPLATDRFLWSHTQLLPAAPATEKAAAHYARSFALIEGNVFEREDLGMCAEAQSGLDSGANESLLFGRLESPALWFHDALNEALAGCAGSSKHSS